MRIPCPTCVSRPTSLSLSLAVAFGIAGCQEAEPPLAPMLSGPEFSHSPDHGLKGTIAFFSYPDGCCDISVMNADGTGVTQLTANGFPGAWSPNGKQITFWSLDPIEVFVMNVDGTGVTRLTENARPCATFRCGDRSTAWSPNGKQIAFASDRDGDIEIFVMNADGSGVKQLTRNDFAADNDPFWSPNGKHIAFNRGPDGGEDIFVMNADGTEVTQLTFNAASSRPAWIARPLR